MKGGIFFASMMVTAVCVTDLLVSAYQDDGDSDVDVLLFDF